ncbi:hypothetical protein [uncultured Psychrobacter sp.]|uniref:hypothetical protein n=1 Tax=uncultured Psychrobacter sp. TaxID=259303 RepID=UPI0032B1E460|tara:strand:- start:2705 stop:3511 length:807 start_codon:yes stop_codon:yes gene_type:complete
MEHITFYTKTRTAHVHVIGLKGSQGETLVVSVHSVKTGKKLNLYKLPLELKDEVSKIKSYSALVAFAKANHIADIVADAKQTSCPVPAPAPAKSAAKGQDILFVEVETEGRGKAAEITEISVVSINETVLFHSHVRPTKPKSNVSMGAPTFDKVWAKLSEVIGRADIAFYNADHSKRMILQSIAIAFDTPIPEHFYTLFPYNKVFDVGLRYELYNNRFPRFPCSAGRQHINSACGQSGLFWRDVSNSASGNAIKSSRLYKYLDHKAVA